MTKPVLVLIHGGGTDARCWGAVRPLLEDRFRILAPDLPGHGDAPAPPEASVEALAAPITDRIAREVPGPYALLGHSLGGMVAMRIAADGPRPDRLILADTFDKPASGLQAWGRIMGMGLAARLLGRRRATEYLIEAQGLGAGGFDADLRASMLHEGAMPLHAMMRAVRRFDGRPLLDRLDMPTLLLMAGGNPATEPAGRRMEARLPDARRVMMPEVGHMQMRDDPEGFAREVIGFLGG
ncbi:Tropinesterase [Jannaschia seosinensis]|uniref:Tropinesterase n=1 Tax=Jannaschia seosinensis TaxID=313367 RepID=A0A0M7BDB7_9RHOB|nr:alpha/beta fold hydrolase [Jannaschia seosinensis]CUH39893.1 Tropinesterase [Jannaschia seosinensis]